MDEESGFNLIQAAVFKGKYDIVLTAHGQLDNFVEEIEFLKTGNKPKCFQGKLQLTSYHLILRELPADRQRAVSDQMLRLPSYLHW